MHTKIWRPVLGALVVVGVLAGCEGAIEHNVERRFAPDSPTVDTDLRSLARAHAEDACTAGALITSPDPEATYGPGSIELVDREALDPALEPPKDDHKATSAIWTRWRVDPRLDTGSWDRMGVGQARCADGYLYLTLVLQDDGTPADFAPGVVRVTAGNAPTSLGGISADGSTVAIRSQATDLVAGTTVPDVYLYDVATNDVTPVGAQLNRSHTESVALTPDGSTLYFSRWNDGGGDDGWFYEIAAVDTATGATSSRVVDQLRRVIIRSTSSDGSTVAVEGAGDVGQAIWADRTTGPDRYLASVASFPISVSISDDGQYASVVGMHAEVHDLADGTATTVQSGCNAFAWTRETNGSGLSADGRYLAYRCIGPEKYEVSVWDRTTGTSQRITSSTDGRHAISNPSISDDGRFVAFCYERPGPGMYLDSPAGTYLWDRTTGRSTLVAPVCAEAAVSGDGSVVAFVAPAPDQTVAGRTDLYVWPNPAA